MLPAVLLTFFAVFMVVCAIILYILNVKESPRTTLKRRMRAIALNQDSSIPLDVKTELLRESSPFERALFTIPQARRLEKLIDHAGYKIKVTRFFLIPLVIIFLILVLFVIFNLNIFLTLALLLLLPVTPFLFLLYKKSVREKLFMEQFPDALTMIARSIRAGHSLSGAVEVVGTELSDPIGELFKTAYEQQKLGLNVAESLQNMNERIVSMDLRFLTTAVSINTSVGGNLAEILDKLAETVRERLRIRRQVQVFTAQGRLSGYVLAALPIAAFFGMNFMIPGYEDILLEEKMGNILLFIGLLMQFVGFLVIRKIINIRI